MGFSLSGTHTIFFIASVIIASTISGAFMAVTTDLSMSLSEQGDRLQEQLETDFEIINDPDNIPISGSDYIFYLKNIGENRLTTTNETFQLFIDGEILPKAKYNFSDGYVYPGDVTRIFVDSSEISAGDHDLKVVGPQAKEDDFLFTI